MLFVVCILSLGRSFGRCCACVQGECACVQGEFACVQGELLWFVALVVLLCVYRRRGAFLASPVRSRYELCSQVDLCPVFGLLIT